MMGIIVVLYALHIELSTILKSIYQVGLICSYYNHSAIEGNLQIRNIFDFWFEGETDSSFCYQ